jgi:hypothetical protein
MISTARRVVYVTPRMPVDADLLEQLAEPGTRLEQQHRFAGPCAEGGCGFWTGSDCGLATELVESYRQVGTAAELPRCSIRTECRWFAEHGRDACAACPHVLTDTRTEQTSSLG